MNLNRWINSNRTKSHHYSMPVKWLTSWRWNCPGKSEGRTILRSGFRSSGTRWRTATQNRTNAVHNQGSFQTARAWPYRISCQARPASSGVLDRNPDQAAPCEQQISAFLKIERGFLSSDSTETSFLLCVVVILKLCFNGQNRPLSLRKWEIFCNLKKS